MRLKGGLTRLMGGNAQTEHQCPPLVVSPSKKEKEKKKDSILKPCLVNTSSEKKGIIHLICFNVLGEVGCNDNLTPSTT